MTKLMKRTVDALDVTGKEYFVWDDEIPCFGVRVLPSGRKSYVIQYKVGGRRGETRRKTLGQHGVLTAEEARNEAKRWLADRAKGKDPIGDHLADRKSETVEQLCRRYLEAAEKGLVLGKRGQPKKASTLAHPYYRLRSATGPGWAQAVCRWKDHGALWSRRISPQTRITAASATGPMIKYATLSRGALPPTAVISCRRWAPAHRYGRVSPKAICATLSPISGRSPRSRCGHRNHWW
jgi:Arm domain-containing DNA-binding protein